MALVENVSGLVDSVKDNLASSAKSFLAEQKGTIIQNFQSAKLEVINKLKQDAQDIAKKQAEIVVKKVKAIKKIDKNKKLTDDQKEVEYKKIDQAAALEEELLIKVIEEKKVELENIIKSYLPQELIDFNSTKKRITDSYQSKLNYSKNAVKFKSYTDIVVAVSIVANLILSQITIGNKKIENLVDRVLDIINNIQTQDEVVKARILVNNAKLIIAVNRKRLKTIEDILNIIDILIPILELLLRLFKLIPVPTTFTTIGITNLAADIQKKVDDIRLTAVTLLGIAQTVVRKMIAELDYQESRLVPIDDILNRDLSNLTSAEIGNLLNSNSNGITDRNSNNGGNNGGSIGGGNNIGGNGLVDVNGRSNNGLGYLEGYDYKGFKFYIKEENNPLFNVKGNKRRYGVAKNKAGFEILQSNYSFTLSPEVLVEELKLQIDQKGLVS
jgi:hypothetical protein